MKKIKFTAIALFVMLLIYGLYAMINQDVNYINWSVSMQKSICVADGFVALMTIIAIIEN